MKKFIKNIALFASMVAMVGCASDPSEVIDGIALNRCLAPTNLEAEIVASVGTDVELTWDAMEGTEYYTVEVFESTETGFDEEGAEVALAPNYDAVEPVKTDTDITEIPHIVTGLEVDKSYFVRVKGHAANIEDSNWTYLEEAFATSAVRSSFKLSVTERTANSISIAWEEGEDAADLTTLRVVPVSDSSKKSVDVTLTAEMIAARAATATGLEACVDYKLTLIYGKACNRGSVTAFTRPSTEGTNYVNTVDAIVSAVTGTTGDVKLVLAYNDGVAYDLTTALSIQCNLYLIGETTTDGKKPVVTGLDLQPAAAIEAIHLEDLVLDGKVYSTEGGQRGNIITATNAINAIEMINCEIFDYTKGLIYVSSSSADFACQNFLVEGCYVHDVNPEGTVGGDFIDIRGGLIPSIILKNNTFYACARTFLRISDNADSGLIEVKNNTFNFVTTTKTSSNNAGIFGVRTKTTPETILCTKNVFLNQYSDGEAPGSEFVRLVRNSSDSNAPVCSGNYFFNVGAGWFVSAATTVAGAAFDEAAALAEGGVLLETDPCQSSGAGKLYLNETSDIAAKQAGDPRWWNAAIPEPPVRATELEVVAEPYIWDFTAKAIYDGETLTAPTIIGNARIYASAEAPTEIKLGTGVYFAEAGMVDAAGEPLYGAVGILTNGYGAVVVTAEGANGVEGVQVLAGGDRYTILADGEPHKVLLGDLKGDNNIYIMAAGGVTLNSIEWTQDLTPDAGAVALKTPAVAFDNRKVDEGTEIAVVASWGAVENADHYVVTFRGTTTEQTETTFTIDAATVAALGVGEYELSVVAVPVATSSKWLTSEAGVAVLQINKVVVGGEKTLLWNFSDTIWETEVFDWLVPLGSDGSKDMDVTVDGLRVVAGGSNIRGYLNETVGNYLQPNGSGSTTKRCFSFTAPANGTLRVKVGCTGSEDLTRVVRVQVGEDGTVMEQPGGHAEPTWVEYDIEAVNQTVYIYPSGGLRFYAIEYTYVEAPTEQTIEWGHAAFDDIWVNGCASNTGNIDATFVTTSMTAGGKLSIDADGFTYDGLQFLLGGGKFKFGQNNNAAGEKVTRVQFGGTGNTGKAVVIFEAPAAGTLKVEAISSGDSSRPLKVAVDGTEVASFDTPDKTGTPQLFEVDCTTAVAGSKIYIYSGNSGINLFSINYTYTK